MFTGYGPFFSMIPDSYPTHIRSSATSLAYVFCRIGGTVTPIVTGALIEMKGGKGLTIVLYAILFGLSGVVILTLKDQSKGKQSSIKITDSMLLLAGHTEE